MRNLILFSFLSLICTLGYTQQAGQIFGLNEENKLCTIDPQTGDISVLSTQSLTSGTAIQAPGAVDTDGERFFFIDTNNRLVIADLNDGVDNDRDGCIDCTFSEDSLGNSISIDDDIICP